MLINKRLLFTCFVLVFSAFLTQANAYSQFPIPTQVAPGKWGYKDSATGHIVIYWHFKYAGRFESNGLAKVAIKDQFGYINTQGVLRIPYSKSEYGPFEKDRAYNVKNHDGYLMVTDKMYAVHEIADFKDAEPRWKLLHDNVKYTYFTYPTDSLRVLSLLNTEPVLISPSNHFMQLEPFMVSSVSQKWGYRNKYTGEVVIFWEFDEAHPFAANGLARVRIGKEYGYIDPAGVLAIPFSTTEYGDFRSDTAFKVNDTYGWIEHRNRQYRKRLSDGQLTEWALLKNETRYRIFNYPADSALVASLMARQQDLDMQKILPSSAGEEKQKARLVITGGKSSRYFIDTFNSYYNNLGIECQFPISHNLLLVGGLNRFTQTVYTPKTQMQRNPLTPALGIMVHTSTGNKTGAYFKTCVLPITNNAWSKTLRSTGGSMPAQNQALDLLAGAMVEIGISIGNRLDFGLGYLYMPMNYKLPGDFENNFRVSIGLNVY